MSSNVTTKKLSRLFIANRGEIARRIATTAGRLGIESVALTDQSPPPGYLMDVVTTFVHVPEESPALYLDAERIVRLAKEAGCDAVHPGFGFLSENAGFAALVEKNGLLWIGPNPRAIDGMASKATARHHAEKAGVPCVKGLTGFKVPDSENGDFSELERFADSAGYPLLIKAAFGGGGKGMRQVFKKDELRQAALRATSEAKNSFGDGALICEQYLTAPRHVEVQILADKHGHVYAIGDRDCSIQRRHQKIVEEAPAPGLTPSTRQALHAAAVSLAAAVGYDSTGTVEFLVDWSDKSRNAKDQSFYFLEMNTRLQVEHPVTEEVYGLDLVEWQLRVARGEALPAHFGKLEARGHSVEVRIYAEDARQGFFPSPGMVGAFKPATGPGLRWEIGLDPIDEITGRFDPMIAKLVATAEDRRGALARLTDGLARTFFAGPKANLDLLHAIAEGGPFVEGAVTTHFLNEHMDGLLRKMDARSAKHAALAEVLLDRLMRGQIAAGEQIATSASHAALTQAAFSSNSSALKSPAGQAARTAAAVDERVSGAAGRRSARSGIAYHDDSGSIAAPGGNARAFWYASWTTGTERHYRVAVGGCHYERLVAKTGAAQADTDHGGTEVLAPVPGKVIAVKAEVGAAMEVGQTILVLESMKMEFEVKAARAGTLAEIHVKTGDQVTAGRALAAWAE